MNKIKLLDNATINKIAAGEVVERPSSVVKELVENAIDADASAVTIEIKEGGISYLRITDNGKGIPKEQVKSAFIRHATSKITAIEDLDSIFSMGFRGEALASIAAVSQLEMTTKTHDEDTGTKITITAGEVLQEQDCGCADGTSIAMHNLFFNVPARRKFLKKAGTESGYVSEVVNRLALGHPDISFQYINNDSMLLHTSGNNDLKTAVFHVYGKDVAKKMIELNGEDREYVLRGLIGRPELSRANRNYETLFINGRYIKNELVSSAVEEAYKTRLMVGKFPFYVLNLNLPPSLVDVNVHPAKLEVRFSDEDRVYNFVYHTVLDSLKEEILIPEADWNSKTSQSVREFIKDYEANKPEQKSLFEQKGDFTYVKPEASEKTEEEYRIPGLLSQSMYKEKTVQEEKGGYQTKAYLEENIVNKPSELIQVLEEEEEEDIFSKLEKKLGDSKPAEKQEIKKKFIPFFSHYKIIGQIFNTYWIVEQNNSIFMIDQHAAHERILFEELMHKFKEETVIAQRLLQPAVVNLSHREKEILKENLDLFQKFGFDIEEFGDTAYALRSVPFIFKGPSEIKYFTDILDILGDTALDSLYDTKVHAVATMACKAAVKANDKLSFQEAKVLIEKLLELENPFNCPHGRPTIIEMTEYELEKKFKRIQ